MSRIDRTHTYLRASTSRSDTPDKTVEQHQNTKKLREKAKCSCLHDDEEAGSLWRVQINTNFVFREIVMPGMMMR